MIVDITAWGADPTAVNNAVAIQGAIDACAEAGGGTVVVPTGGVFVSGSIHLRSKVELHLQRGAVLKCSADWSHITHRLSGMSYEGYEADELGIFIGGDSLSDVAITGPGTIDGAGRTWVLEDLGPIYRMPAERPYLVFLIGCSDVVLRDTRFVDGAFWMIRVTGCDRVLMDGIQVEADWKVPNADGIDIDRSRDVRIANSVISTPDDAIALHCTSQFEGHGDTENVVITNCVLKSRSSAVVIGALLAGAVRNVVVSGCVVKMSNRGLSVNLSQAGSYENFLFTDIVVETQLEHESWWGRGEPIYVGAAPWLDELGTARNIRFTNILARSENGVYIESVELGHLSDILLENVRVEIDRWTQHVGGRYDRRPYSGEDELFEHPTAGYFIRKATDVTLRNCEVVWGASATVGLGVDANDAPGLVVERFRESGYSTGRGAAGA